MTRHFVVATGTTATAVFVFAGFVVLAAFFANGLPRQAWRSARAHRTRERSQKESSNG
jgi:hypothetical protein